MSKIGRKPIEISGVQVEIKGQNVHYKGPKSSGVHTLPSELGAEIDGQKFKLVAAQTGKEVNRLWGLHRALLYNELTGSRTEFVTDVLIVGLGYKAVKSGDTLVFSLGFSHKIDFKLPKDVT